MMDINIRNLLQSLNALHTGNHFVYTSGEHGDAYANLRVLKEDKYHEQLAHLSVQLIEKVLATAEIDQTKPITIVGPDTLGKIITDLGTSGYNAIHGTSLRWLRLEAYNVDGEKEFKWDNDFVPARTDEQVIYVDDLMNAGSTWTKCREIVGAYGKVCAIGTIADRSGYSAHDLKVPYFISLVQFTLERFKPEDCPHCKNLVPIVRKPGHGHEFEVTNPNYAGRFVDL
jgi:orotate phosphoribosyltransferase